LKAIIVAAGVGSRLNPLTDGRPKCLLEVKGKTILERALDALHDNGIEQIAVVRGYCGHLLDFPDLTYCENPDFRRNNILQSLFCAEIEMDDDFIFSYSDIVYSSEIVAKLIDSKADFAITVDTKWDQTYEGRDLHPIAEAELVKVENGKVTRIGKGAVNPEDAHGEFIGLAKFTKSAAETMKSIYHRVKEDHRGAPFQNAVSLDKAYMTDMIQEIVDMGSVVESVDIEGGWREIDTPQDLERAQRLFCT
jgi:choline kinase